MAILSKLLTFPGMIQQPVCELDGVIFKHADPRRSFQLAVTKWDVLKKSGGRFTFYLIFVSFNNNLILMGT
jgi:hypothetical protein